jgi:hypothetical protein
MRDERGRNAQIKIIQKFLGRLRVDNRNWESILSELSSLNLSKYQEEISNVIANYVT